MASIQKKINSRPRPKLKFETPKAEFFIVQEARYPFVLIIIIIMMLLRGKTKR